MLLAMGPVAVQWMHDQKGGRRSKLMSSSTWQRSTRNNDRVQPRGLPLRPNSPRFLSLLSRLAGSPPPVPAFRRAAPLAGWLAPSSSSSRPLPPPPRVPSFGPSASLAPSLPWFSRWAPGDSNPGRGMRRFGSLYLLSQGLRVGAEGLEPRTICRTATPSSNSRGSQPIQAPARGRRPRALLPPSGC